MQMIITADWHIRATRPRCRTDIDWIETQEKALRQIYKLAEKKEASVFVVGDVFHSNSDTSFECINLVQRFAQNLEDIGLNMFILAGNHDLPYHSSEYLGKSAIGVLLQSNNVRLIQELGFDISAPNFDEKVENKKLVFRHVLTFKDRKDIPPNVEAKTAQELLDETPSADYVFIGDNHHRFVYENKNRYVINPGCLLRQVSDMKDYECGVYYVDTENNNVEEHLEFFPIIDEEELVDDSYILKENEREKRIEKFVDKLKDTKNVSLDFIENVENAILENKIDDKLKNIIQELLEV